MSLEDLIHPYLNRYVASPQWLKSLLGGVYSRLPIALGRGRAYPRFQRELEHSDSDAIGGLARRKLAATLHWAIETVPAYADFHSLLCELDDPEIALRRLPLLTKSIIRRSPTSYLSTAMSKSRRLKTFTGGSTAVPLLFYLHKHITRPKEYAFMDDFERRLGLVVDREVVLALRGRTVGSAARSEGPIWMYEPIKRQVILSSGHLLARNMPAYVAALRKWRPAIIQAFPSALYPLARWLAEYPAPDVTERIRGVLLYSENVYDFQVRLIRQVFDCPVLKHYGHSERVLMAASMLDDDRFFFWPQYGHFELVDEAGQPITRPGVIGEIVGTSFDNQVMPFIRYRTGDLAVLSEQPHPLLPGYPAVERIEGRLQEFLVTRDKRLISICTMGAAHFEALAGVSAIQYEQHEPGRFILRVVSPTPLHASVRETIAQAVMEKTQGGCAVEILEVDDIPRSPRGKHQMLVQHLDIGNYPGTDRVE